MNDGHFIYMHPDPPLVVSTPEGLHYLHTPEAAEEILLGDDSPTSGLVGENEKMTPENIRKWIALRELPANLSVRSVLSYLHDMLIIEQGLLNEIEILKRGGHIKPADITEGRLLK